MHKTAVGLEKHPGIVTYFKSFEFTDVLLKHSSLLRNSLKNFLVSWSL